MLDEKDKLLRRCLDGYEWMVEEIKWHYDDCKGNLDNGSQGKYSPKLTEAMKVRDDLEKYFKQGR
jgi:hypothetical protein